VQAQARENGAQVLIMHVECEGVNYCRENGEPSKYYESGTREGKREYINAITNVRIGR